MTGITEKFCDRCGYFYTKECQCSRQEKEANYFARCLLMPADLVRKEIEKMGGVSMLNDLHIHLLAVKFQVNDSLMAHRIGEIDALQSKDEQ